MNFDDLSQEQQIMVVMRKLLTTIVRELTPPPGTPHPLSAHTIEDIRVGLKLIAARERELLEAKGEVKQELPHDVDEPQTAQILHYKPKEH